MKRKLNCILLIDDNKADNFFHRIVIEEEVDCAEQVSEAKNGEEALKFLTEIQDGEYPDLIFLDINMPRMNGWEFIRAYEKSTIPLKKEIVIVMLTTSMNPEDEVLAQSIACIHAFRQKPLTPEILIDILGSFFPNNQ